MPGPMITLMFVLYRAGLDAFLHTKIEYVFYRGSEENELFIHIMN
jgi:hypothetical protein